MRRWLDWVFLILAFLALIVQIIVATLPGLSDLVRFIPLAVLLACTLYFLIVRVLPSSLPLRHRADDLVTVRPAAVYRYLANRYGIGYAQLRVELTIAPDGSGMVRRTVDVDAYSEIGRLDTFLVIPETPPPGQTWEPELLAIRSLTPGWNAGMERSRAEGGMQSVVLTIAPKLAPGDHVTYVVDQRLPAGLYAVDLTADQMSRRKQTFDYFGWAINRPTRSFSLLVYFPVGYKPESYDFSVWYASSAPGIPSELTQYEEQKSLKRPSLLGPEGGRYCLALEVDTPMLGLIYDLRWEPISKPPQAEVE